MFRPDIAGHGNWKGLKWVTGRRPSLGSGAEAVNLVKQHDAVKWMRDKITARGMTRRCIHQILLFFP
jgi:hypothetical protein